MDDFYANVRECEAVHGSAQMEGKGPQLGKKWGEGALICHPARTDLAVKGLASSNHRGTRGQTGM